MGFNPHTHAGCDIVILVLVSLVIGFNPHTHAGCDIRILQFFVAFGVSIHTPTQGVTRFQQSHSLSQSFNPHTHAGCDPVNTAAYTRIKVSIHTPTQGVTEQYGRDNLIPFLFQSTHPRRV